MRYLGMDVHAKATVWCLVDAQGEVVSEGRTPTTASALATLVRELGQEGEVLAGQEDASASPAGDPVRLFFMAAPSKRLW